MASYLTTQVELLALDLDTCGRCVGTDANLDAAVAAVRATTGRQIDVRRHVITTLADAVRLRMASSPTIRVNGADIAPEIIESTCEADVCACASGAHINCRAWSFGGQIFEAPPVEMIVAAIMGAENPRASEEPFEVPQNLRAFFATPRAACCAPEVQASCCEPEAKEVCCGTATSDGEPCGCR